MNLFEYHHLLNIFLIICVACLSIGINVISAEEPSKEVWNQLAPMPTARTETIAIAVEEKIYVLGGYNIHQKGIDSVEVYNTMTNSWEKIAPLPQELNHMAAAAYNNEIYVIGGYANFEPITSDKLYIYNIQSDTWRQGPSMPSPRAALTAQFVGDTLFVIGGQDGEPIPPIVLATNEAFNTKTNSWETKSPMPTPREHLTSSVIDGKIYVIGGRHLNPSTNYANNEVYDPKTDSWEILENMPTPRGGIASAAINGTIFVFGGETWTEVYGNNEQYIPDQGWQIHAPMQIPRHGLGAATVGEKIYVIGGGVSAGMSISGVNESYYNSHYVPEFGELVSLILVVSLISTILILSKSKLRLIPKI